MPTPEQQKIIKAEFGRIKGVTADDARERAEQLQNAADAVSTRTRAEAMRNKAEQLQEWAADFEAEADAETADDTAETTARTETTSKPAARRAAGRKPKSRGRGAKAGRKLTGGQVGRALKRATVDRPGRIAAGAIDSTASWFWLLVVSTLAAALVYRLVTNPGKTEALGAQLSTAVERAIYPKTAFPERYSGAQVQGSKVQAATGAAKKGQ